MTASLRGPKSEIEWRFVLPTLLSKNRPAHNQRLPVVVSGQYVGERRVRLTLSNSWLPRAPSLPTLSSKECVVQVFKPNLPNRGNRSYRGRREEKRVRRIFHQVDENAFDPIPARFAMWARSNNEGRPGRGGSQAVTHSKHMQAAGGIFFGLS